MLKILKKLSVNKVAINIGILLGYGIVIVAVDLYLFYFPGDMSFIANYILEKFGLALLVVIGSSLLFSNFLNKRGITGNHLSFKKSFLLIIIIFNIVPILTSINFQSPFYYISGLILPFIFYNFSAVLAATPIYFLYKLSDISE